MDNSVVAGWTDFFVAAAAAVGALAGLVFVALSINLARIIELPGISGRAAETVTLLSAALIASLVVLVPDLSVRRLGVLLLIIWIPAWMVPTIHQVREERGLPRLQRDSRTREDPVMIAAVDHRINGCSVMVMHGNTSDVRPLPALPEGPAKLERIPSG